MRKKPNSTRDDLYQLGDAIVANDLSTIRSLLARGVSPDCRVWNWNSALHAAVKLCRTEVVNILLESGAFPGPALRGEVPLAEATLKGSKSIVENLLSYGAPIDRTATENWFTSIEFAALKDRADLVTSLCQAGANPNQTIQNCFSIADWPMQTPNRNDVFHELSGARTGRETMLQKPRLISKVPILLGAVACRCRSAVKTLIEFGADPSLRDSDGNNLDAYFRRHGPFE